jgi:hypothetical protein
MRFLSCDNRWSAGRDTCVSKSPIRAGLAFFFDEQNVRRDQHRQNHGGEHAKWSLAGAQRVPPRDVPGVP